MNHPRRSFVVRLLLDHAPDHNLIRMNLKTKKLSVTIPRRNLPKFDTTIEPKSCSASRITTATQNVFAVAQRDIEIARERGFSLNEIFTYDLLPTNPLFYGDFTTATHDKSKLFAELEKYLVSSAMTETRNISVDGLKAVTFIDSMSRIRQYTNLSHFNNFGAVVNSVVTAGIKS